MNCRAPARHSLSSKIAFPFLKFNINLPGFCEFIFNKPYIQLPEDGHPLLLPVLSVPGCIL